MKLGVSITLAAAALALVVTASTAGAAAGGSHQHRGAVPQLRHARHLGPASRTMKRSKLRCVVSCAAYESTINQYFTDIAAAGVAGATDNVYSVATEYSSIQYNVTFGGSVVDGNPFPKKHTCNDAAGGAFDTYCVTDAQLQTEIGKVIAANGWPTHTTTALYFIFTPANVGVCGSPGDASTNGCTTNAFCAYHSNTQSNSFLYAVEPDAAAVADGACDPLQHPAGNAADATINTISHEHIEAITDPFPSPATAAWFSNDVTSYNPEIGDLCAYQFGTTQGEPGTEYNQVINGHNYLLQLEYSNAADSGAGGCVPYLGGPVTAVDPENGAGPLADHGGAVMTTNTVYAIYWVPTTPTKSDLPAISGAKKVGKTLTASSGTWSNAPKFAYQWLRCSARGKSCKPIPKATHSTHNLVTADSGHRLKVRVSMPNAPRSASATSRPTSTIKN